VLRAVVGLVLLLAAVGLLLVFENALLGIRADLETMQEGWPSWIGTAMDVAAGLTMLVVILGTNAFLLWKRLFRRWIMINAAAIVAILLAAVASNLVLAIASSDALQTALDRSAEDALGNDLLASLVAVLTVGSVWIGPKLRPWAVAMVAVAATFSFLPGAVSVVTLPFDVGVGLLAGSLVALVLKTRDRAATATELAKALAQGGIHLERVERASVDARGSVPWFATTVDGDELFIKTLNSDQRAADLLFRIYRMVRLRQAGDRRPYSSLRRAVEHEAFLSLAADARSGIRTPALVTVGTVSSDSMLLAYEKVEGRSLDAVEPEEITDEILSETWALVAALRSTGIAHRDLRLANLFLGDDGVTWLIDFGFAELAADESLIDRDTAELLASTAAVVGAERAVAAARRVVGDEAIAGALPWIQPLALSTATRTQIGKSEAYKQLREVAARVAGVEEVDFERIERVKPGTILVLATVALALYALVPQAAAATGFFDELSTADLRWVGVAVAASLATYVGATMGMLGAVPVRLYFWPVMQAQVASSFSNRVTPAKVGGMATNVRFLQKQNITLATAASAVGMNTVAGSLIHVSMLALFGVVASRDVSLPLPDARLTAIVVGAIILLSGVVMIIPLGRKLLTRHLVPALKAAAGSIAAIARTPAKLLALFTGSALVTVAYTAAMLASLAAFDADLPLATAVAVYLAGAAVATAAPTPGGLGATEAALVAGYTAVGVEAATAFAAVLLFRLVTFWLPILPGWWALVSLQRTGRL
jgi:uncharacterized protein (TIRG00374 family)